MNELQDDAERGQARFDTGLRHDDAEAAATWYRRAAARLARARTQVTLRMRAS